MVAKSDEELAKKLQKRFEMEQKYRLEFREEKDYYPLRTRAKR